MFFLVFCVDPRTILPVQPNAFGTTWSTVTTYRMYSYTTSSESERLYLRSAYSVHLKSCLCYPVIVLSRSEDPTVQHAYGLHPRPHNYVLPQGRQKLYTSPTV